MARTRQCRPKRQADIIRRWKVNCYICTEEFLRLSDYEAHLKTHFPSSEKHFQCDICDKSFGSQAWLTRHSKTHSVKIQLSEFETGFVTDAFSIFPREIWCMILDNVPYFRDRLQIFQAIPELEGFYRRTKQLYLFDQVIPHIAEWADEGDLLNCRLVARQWTMGVDSFVENHPSSRPYPRDEADQQSTGAVQGWDPINYSKCYFGQCFDNKSLDQFLYRKYFDRAYSFRFDNIYDFLLKTECHPVNINPFVGRSIEVGLDLDYEIRKRLSLSEDLETLFKRFLNHVYTLLKKWGRHIWFLTIVMAYNTDQGEGEFIDFLGKSLAFLPNLKSLHVSAGHKLYAGDYDSKILPNLPHLETLQISTIPLSDPMVNKMLWPHYSQQIRRLHLQLQDAFNYFGEPVTVRCKTSVPNLRELIITDRSRYKWKTAVDNILSSIQAPQLCSLGFRFMDPPMSFTIHSAKYPDTVYLQSLVILEWLHIFPCLKHFYLPHRTGLSVYIDIDKSVCKWATMGTQATWMCSSLESICLHFNTFRDSLDTFKFLPSIQCLQIFANLPWFDYLPESEEESFVICNRTLQLECFWEVLQNLKKLKVIIIIDCEYRIGPGPRYRFSKAAVEKYLRKMGAIE